jgi:hypothetical protein
MPGISSLRSKGPHFVTRRTRSVTLGPRNGVKSLTETATGDRLASAVGWPDFLRRGGVKAAAGGATSRRLAYISLHLRRRGGRRNRERPTVR